MLARSSAIIACTCSLIASSSVSSSASIAAPASCTPSALPPAASFCRPCADLTAPIIASALVKKAFKRLISASMPIFLINRRWKATKVGVGERTALRGCKRAGIADAY